jgi:hypothetical protein
MPSLTDAYDGAARTVAGRRRRRFGTALFAVGAVMVVGAIPVATTDLARSAGLSVFEARELAGVLAGVGLPAFFVGIFAVLPASRPTRAAASIGASLAGFGVALFVHAYPLNWLANDPPLAIATTLIYGIGTLTTFWCLFLALATFKRRNDPGGTARMEITEEGKLRIISDTTSRAAATGFGAVGLFGQGPDGDVATQTNRGGSAGGSSTSGDGDEGVVLEEPTPTPSADGAGAISEPAEADDEVVEAVNERGRPDEYCGNCAHFEYVRADGELTPYCGFHDDLMEDMDACDQWDANSEPTPRT